MTTDQPAAPAPGDHIPFVRGLRQSLVLRSAGLLATWLLVWKVGWLVEYADHTSVWFPAAGLTFAALMVMGPWALPTLLVGCVIVTFADARQYQLALSDSEVLKAGLLFGMAHILPYGLGAAALRSMVRRDVRDLTRLIVTFLVIAAATALLATGLVLSSLVVSHMMPASEVASAWLPFWVGDMAGVMVLAPLFVGLLNVLLPGALFQPADLPDFPYHPPSAKFAYKLGLTAALLTGSMLLAKVTHSPNSAFAVFFLVIPHMWIAGSESPLVNALSVAFSSFLIAFLVHVFRLMDFVMVYQFAISVIAANTLFVLAVPTLLAHNIQLRAAAFTDSLTQVASRDRVERRAALEIVRCSAEGHALALMVFDIDHFKGINDTHGHQVGDQALQQICQVAQESLRPTDILGRIGGDEFVVLLPHTSLAAAEQIAARIIEQLRRTRVGSGYELTASFGVAEWQRKERYENLFKRADRALYRAKLNGRDRVVAESMG